MWQVTTTAYIKTFYYSQFVGQLTASEPRTLNAGGFLQTTSDQFYQGRLEQYVVGHERFSPKFHPDKRTKEFISSKKKLFSSVYPKTRNKTKRKRKASDTSALHVDQYDRHRTYRGQYGKGKPHGKGKYPKGYY